MPAMGTLPGLSPVPAFPSQGGADPVALLAALERLAGGADPAANRIYRPGYRKPPRPTESRIVRQGNLLVDQNAQWRFMVENMMRWLRQELTGVFAEDREARRQGLQEEYVSSALSDERNLFVARLASMQMTVKKLYLDPSLRRESQMVEDAVMWLRAEQIRRHVAYGNRPLPIDEASMLTDYGMIACRHPMNPNDPDFPLQIDLIDPLQVNVVWGRHGPETVIRVYKDTAEQIAADYGDFSKSTYTKLSNKYGKEGFLDPKCEIPVYEYWDTWYRAVLVDDEPLIPITEHAYGCCPWTIQYGGLGEPMFTRTGSMTLRQGSTTEYVVSDGFRADERMNKAVPLVYYGLRRHETYEAVMARLLMAFKKEVNPPFFRRRPMDLDGTPMPEVDSGPGKQNELKEGEGIEPWPQLAGGPATQMVMQALGIDRATNSAPMAMRGQSTQSQVTGAAMNEMEDAGEHHFFPFTVAYTNYHQQLWDNILYILKEHGDDAKYGGATPSPLMVPYQRPKQGEAPAFELGQELLQKVGTRVQVKFNRVNPRDWLALFNAGQVGVANNFIEPEVIAEMAGVSDYDGMFQRLMEHKSAVKLFEHPKYLEMFEMPAMIMEQIKQNEGDPLRQQWWMERLQRWEQFAQMQMMPPGGGQPGAPTGQPGAPGAMPNPQNPPTAAGVSYPALGQGPGTEGGAVGRPQNMEGP